MPHAYIQSSYCMYFFFKTFIINFLRKLFITWPNILLHGTNAMFRATEHNLDLNCFNLCRFKLFVCSENKKKMSLFYETLSPKFSTIKEEIRHRFQENVSINFSKNKM